MSLDIQITMHLRFEKKSFLSLEKARIYFEPETILVVGWKQLLQVQNEGVLSEMITKQVSRLFISSVDDLILLIKLVISGPPGPRLASGYYPNAQGGEKSGGINQTFNQAFHHHQY